MSTENTYDLPVWEHPDCYGGFSPDGDFVIYSRNKDSSILENSNYERILEELEAKETSLDLDNNEPFIYDFRTGHWACGWVEYIMVSKNAPDELQALASEIIGALLDYPVFDESDYSERQYEAIHEYWENLSMRERIEYCANEGESIFSARRLPESVYYRLNEKIY